MSFTYILRYFIDPESPARSDRIEELARFCRKARVEEVMLFSTPEERSPGHPLPGEVEAFIALARCVRERLAQEGVALSLNPWTTLGQVPRGRRLRGGQDFGLMVGETGAQSLLVACPLCARWQAYLCGFFARLAAEVEPVAIWVEDDWRLHNHGGPLGWGGCFCEAHLARFARQVGEEELTRDAVLEAALAPGVPHPWREQWLALSRASLLEPLAALSAAIRKASPATRVGLMSSHPDQHAAEGRDWAALHEALGAEAPLLLRPHMLPYTQERIFRTTPAILRATLACVEGRPLESYPELENSPRCGLYSKSNTATLWQVREAALLGCGGITINAFDMLGNGTALDPSLAGYFAAAKPWVNAVRALGLEAEGGVEVCFSPEISRYLHLCEPEAEAAGADLAMRFQNPAAEAVGGGLGFAQLVHSSLVWSEVCTLLGVAHRPTCHPGAGPVLASGQTLRAFPEETVLRLLSGVLVLDAVAAEGLLKEGKGAEIGLAAARWRTLEESAFAYEETEGGVRMSAQRCASRMLEMEPHPGCHRLTEVFNAEGALLWPGMTLWTNARGGVVVALAYPLDGGGQFFMGFFNPFRRELLQRLLREVAPSAPLAMCGEGARCHRVRTATGERGVVVQNPLEDRLERVTLRLGKAEAAPTQWRVLGPQAEWRELPAEPQATGEWSLPLVLEPFESALLLLPE